MTTEVDLSQLAIERRSPADLSYRPRAAVLTRYVLPAVLLAGFLGVVAWAARDMVFPPRSVQVVPVLVSQSAVQQAGTPLFQAAGWIEPRPTPTRVAALSPGVIEELLVVEDQPVQAGEPIAELVKEDAQLAYERTAADLKLREAELQEAQSVQEASTIRFEEPVHLQAALSEAETMLAKVDTAVVNLPFEIRRAEARLRFARQDYEAASSAAGAVAKLRLEESLSELSTAQAMLEELHQRTKSLAAEKSALSKRVKALARQLELKTEELQAKGRADAQVKAAEARVAQARAALAEAKLALDRMTVRAPIDGRVLHLISDPGTRVMSGMMDLPGRDGSTVVTMYQPDLLQVRVDVRFEDLPQVRLGQPVTIDSPAIPEPLEGEVLFLGSVADIQKNTLEVKVAIHNPPEVFKPDMLVDVTFLAAQGPGEAQPPGEQMRLLVPQELIRSGESGSFVWLADQSAGVAKPVTVQTGATTPEGLSEVTQGLTPGARLIATDLENLRPGDRIRVTGEAQAVASTSAAKSRRAQNRLPQGDH